MTDNTDFEKTAVSTTDIDATQAVATPVAERTTMSANVECPVCRTPNPPSERYCIDCGFLLAQQPVEVEALPELSSAGVLATPDGSREFLLKPGENTVGRENADILLNHNSVSRRHAVIRVEEGLVAIEDAGSTNGTFVNGSQIERDTPTELFDGVELRFGNEALILRLSSPQEKVEGEGEVLLEPTEEDTWECEAPADMEAYEGAEADETSTGEVQVPAPVARLKSKDGLLVFDLSPGAYKIGRRQGDNDIVIPDPYTSGRHADLAVDYGKVVVTDIGSSNGTSVNGAKIESNAPCEVHPGDEIVVGQMALMLEAV